MSFIIAHIGFGWFGRLLKEENEKLPLPFDIKFYNRTPVDGSDRFELGIAQKTPLGIKEANLLTITIPPSSDLMTYQKICEEIKDHWPLDKPIIFMSTTSVFPNESNVFDEKSDFKPDSPRSQVLREIEKDLVSTFQKALIIRSGGQVGRNRHPLSFLSKTGRPFEAKERINFIHGEDLSSLYLFLFQKIQSHIELPSYLHAVSPQHPTKEEYYRLQAELWGVHLPPKSEKSALQRIINSCHLEALGFQFKKADCLVEKY